MQGPFSMELNQAMLAQYQCKYLVTKDSGKAGGFLEKIQAAEACGATVVIIGRPLVEEGLSLRECRHTLIETLWTYRETEGHTSRNRNGKPEDPDAFRTGSCSKSADLIVGAKRMADAVRFVGQDFLYEYRSKEILEYAQGTSGVYKGCSCTFRGCGILQRSEETCGTSRTGDRNRSVGSLLWFILCQRSVCPGTMQRSSAHMAKPATSFP